MSSESSTTTEQQTPLEVIATISRVITKSVDRITGDRSDYPLLVAYACVEALKNFGIESRIMYGQVAWIEILADHSPIWAGCWGENVHFWVATQYGEVVDLNTSVAHRKRAHDRPEWKAQFSPPMIWSAEIPGFCRYIAEGVAEIELHDPKDQQRLDLVLKDVHTHCNPEVLASLTEAEFPNEPILCPGRRLLDDSSGSFKQFDRALSVRGIPQSPI